MVKIDSVIFGEITVGGRTYYSDVIVWWDGKVELVGKTHKIGTKELSVILLNEPEIIVIGRGLKNAAKLMPEFRQVCRDRDIKVYSDPTEKAVEFFNGLMASGKKAAGLFHVTF